MKLFKLEKWYNPFGIEVSGHTYIVDKIIAFNSNGEVAVSFSGWFGNNNCFDELNINCDCVLKRKVDFSLQTVFIVSLGERDWAANHMKCILYIPESVLKLEKSVTRNQKYISIIHKSTIYNGITFTKIVSIYSKALSILEKIRALGNDLKISFDINKIESVTAEIQSLIAEYKAEVQRVDSLPTEELLKNKIDNEVSHLAPC